LLKDDIKNNPSPDDNDDNFDTDLRARLAVIVCVDENGKQIFTDRDVEWLTQLPARPLTRINNAAKELNEISDEDEEELTKNKLPILAQFSGNFAHADCGVARGNDRE
jgi:hypothetical protein